MVLTSLRAAFAELVEWLDHEANLREDECDPTIAQECGYLRAAVDAVSVLWTGCGDLGLFDGDKEATTNA